MLFLLWLETRMGLIIFPVTSGQVLPKFMMYQHCMQTSGYLSLFNNAAYLKASKSLQLSFLPDSHPMTTYYQIIATHDYWSTGSHIPRPLPDYFTMFIWKSPAACRHVTRRVLGQGGEPTPQSGSPTHSGLEVLLWIEDTSLRTSLDWGHSTSPHFKWVQGTSQISRGAWLGATRWGPCVLLSRQSPANS